MGKYITYENHEILQYVESQVDDDVLSDTFINHPHRTIYLIDNDNIVYDVLCSCTKYFRAPYIKAVLSMEVLSETDQAQSESAFFPNIFVNIFEYIDRNI